MKKHLICPLCASSNFKALPKFNRSHLVKCRSCSLVFSEKIPTNNELEEHYSHYNRGRHVSDLTIKRYEQLLNEFSKYKQAGKVIDVGCGSGFFLDVAARMKWDAYGTEFGIDAVEFCKAKGHNVFEGPIETIELEPDTFDIVTSFEVIEHLTYPKEHFEKLFKILRPGGILYVTTPNFNAVTRYILKDRWNIISYPEHLTYFTATTLDEALLAAGFRRKKLIADGISVDRLRNSLKKNRVVSENDNPDKISKKIRITNESVRQATENNQIFKVLRKSVDWSLDITRKGEFLKGYYLKPK